MSLNNLKISNGEIKTPFLIGVAGGTASGKVSLPELYLYITRTHLSFAVNRLQEDHRATRPDRNGSGAATGIWFLSFALSLLIFAFSKVVCISQDSFYRDLTAAEEAKAKKGLFNFDHPDAFNEELMYNTLTLLLEGKIVEIPTYDYRSNSL